MVNPYIKKKEASLILASIWTYHAYILKKKLNLWTSIIWQDYVSPFLINPNILFWPQPCIKGQNLEWSEQDNLTPIPPPSWQAHEVRTSLIIQLLRVEGGG